MKRVWPFKYHFFVSYTARENETAYIKQLILEYTQGLKILGFNAWPFWFDLTHLGVWRGTDTSLKCELAKAIDNCITMVSFVSPKYLNSNYCAYEWEHMRWTSPVNQPFCVPIVWKEINAEKPSKIPEILYIHHIRVQNASEVSNAVVVSAALLDDRRLHRWQRWRSQPDLFKKTARALENLSK